MYMSRVSVRVGKLGNAREKQTYVERGVHSAVSNEPPAPLDFRSTIATSPSAGQCRCAAGRVESRTYVHTSLAVLRYIHTLRITHARSFLTEFESDTFEVACRAAACESNVAQ